MVLFIQAYMPGKENCADATKFHPLSLVNAGRKVLEKILINRIKKKKSLTFTRGHSHTTCCSYKLTFTKGREADLKWNSDTAQY